MTREIKFRAWDKDYRKYKEVEELNAVVKKEYPDLRSVYTHPSYLQGDKKYQKLYDERNELLLFPEKLTAIEKGKMYYDVNISNKGKVMFLEGGWDYQGDNNYIVMQYTGLKDRNGKEIYEGDILSLVLHYKERILKVVFKDGYFTTDNWTAYMPQLFNESEVIGNKYSNPDLLTNK